MFARSKKHYRRVWLAHVADTTTLMIAADVSFEEAEEMRTRLRSYVERAVERANLPETDDLTEKQESRRDYL